MISTAACRQILHLDMDAFYASVEQHDNPELAGRPVIVGGGSLRGVVSAASYEARRFGIHSAMPIATARRLCPEGFYLPVRMARYQQVSGRVFEIFERYTPLVEPLSLDEAFLDVSSSTRLFGNGVAIARRIKDEVRRETGLTVSAGVAASKLIAKIASDLDKPDGLTVVEPGREKEFLAPLPISRLWGAGPATCRELRLLGVEKIGDLCRLSLELLERKFGKLGSHLHRVAQGLDERPVEPGQGMKSVGHEDTFDRDLTDMNEIRRELFSLADRVGRRLRGYGTAGRTVTLKVKYSDFTVESRSRTLAEATDDGAELYRQALALLPKTKAGSRPVRLLGISVSSLENEQDLRQPSLLPPPPGRTKRRQVNQAVDAIKEKFGSTAILPGSFLKDQ